MIVAGTVRLGIALLALSFVAPAVASRPSRDAGGACRVEGAVFELDFGWTKAPTKAAVILPSGKLLRLRDPAEDIDTLGSAYPGGRLRVDAASLLGIDHSMRHVPVFGAPGKYEFLFQDANTAEDMDLHRVHCTVTLSDEQASAIGRKAGG